MVAFVEIPVFIRLYYSSLGESIDVFWSLPKVTKPLSEPQDPPLTWIQLIQEMEFLVLDYELH